MRRIRFDLTSISSCLKPKGYTDNANDDDDTNDHDDHDGHDDDGRKTDDMMLMMVMDMVMTTVTTMIITVACVDATWSKWLRMMMIITMLMVMTMLVLMVMSSCTGSKNWMPRWTADVPTPSPSHSNNPLEIHLYRSDARPMATDARHHKTES